MNNLRLSMGEGERGPQRELALFHMYLYHGLPEVRSTLGVLLGAVPIVCGLNALAMRGHVWVLYLALQHALSGHGGLVGVLMKSKRGIIYGQEKRSAYVPDIPELCFPVLCSCSTGRCPDNLSCPFLPRIYVCEGRDQLIWTPVRKSPRIRDERSQNNCSFSSHPRLVRQFGSHWCDLQTTLGSHRAFGTPARGGRDTKPGRFIASSSWPRSQVKQ